jgi:hypothetical protein
LFPQCAALDPKRHRNGATLLRTCGVLSGRDRLAAALVMNGSDAFRGVEGARSASTLAPHFAPDVVIDWAGERAMPGDAGRFWATRMGPGDGSVAHLWVDRLEGLASDRVRLTGEMGRSVDTPRGSKTGTETAFVEQLWTRQPDGVFRVSRATVTPWRTDD